MSNREPTASYWNEYLRPRMIVSFVAGGGLVILLAAVVMAVSGSSWFDSLAYLFVALMVIGAITALMAWAKPVRFREHPVAAVLRTSTQVPGAIDAMRQALERCHVTVSGEENDRDGWVCDGSAPWTTAGIPPRVRVRVAREENATSVVICAWMAAFGASLLLRRTKKIVRSLVGSSALDGDVTFVSAPQEAARLRDQIAVGEH
jgi:hypothetical protein